MISDTTVKIAGSGRDRLRGLRDEQFAETMRRTCENIPFYREAFETASVSPAEVSGTDDIERFPFTAPEDFCDRCLSGLFAVDVAPCGTLDRRDGGEAQRVFDARTDT